jgi:hypothetical protein
MLAITRGVIALALAVAAVAAEQTLQVRAHAVEINVISGDE